jgi:hypothetical protein
MNIPAILWINLPIQKATTIYRKHISSKETWLNFSSHTNAKDIIYIMTSPTGTVYRFYH